ncbi:MAG: RNA polymerase sigma factor [Acidimicrobiales bacterium]
MTATVLIGDHGGNQADGSVAAPPPVSATDDFADFFGLQYPRLVRALGLAGAARGDAEDLAQEAFARVFRHWRRVRRGSSPAGYLYRTAFRLLTRHGLIPASALDDDQEPDPSPGPEERAVHAVDFERALAAMPPRRRACVLLCWCFDASPAEAAGTLGIAPGTVRKQLELARRTLRLADTPAPRDRSTTGVAGSR